MRNGIETIRQAFPGARVIWDVEQPDQVNGRLSAILIGSVVAIVHSYSQGDGWQVYTPTTDDGEIEATLDALAVRCKVQRQTEAK